MKKWLVIFIIILLASIIGVYFLIPTTKVLAYETTITCTEDGATRQIVNPDKWQLWWPGKKTGEPIYNFKEYDYRIDKILLDGFEATIFNDKDSAKASMQIFPVEPDSIKFIWTLVYNFSASPVKRLSQYFNYRTIKNNMKALAGDIKKHFEKEENIYGMKVSEQKVTNSSLISLKQSFSHYPTTREVYDLVNSLKEYIKEKQEEEVNYPMLNVHREQQDIYETMVAIPTKRDLPSEGKFQLKKMALGNILMAEIKGGPQTIIKGEEELRNYVNDFRKISPAIPYQSLVTNRLLEPDTSKWITRLYYPVFN